jgi:sigma-B regulation protein RsbU (phosphoserine phosphatase)
MSSPGPIDPYESAACGLLVLARDGRIERANATFCQWLGWSAAELQQKRFQELLSVGSKLFHQTHWMPLLQLQGSVAEVQFELVHREGRALAALVNASLFSRADTPGPDQGWVHVAVFIATDRRKYERELLLARRRAEELLTSERGAQQARALAEDRLRLALDSASLYTWNIELPAGVATYDRQAGALLGRPELQHVSAEMYAQAIHPADRERERAAFSAALDAGERAQYRVEYRLIGLDGVERTIHATGRAFFDDAGAAVGFSGVLEDVTSRRQAEQARAKEAEQRAVLAEQLVGIVSHDLRNPLNAVILGTHLLRSSELSPTHARVVSRIASAVERANRLVADLLDFTQARLGGGLRVAVREVDLHALVIDVVEELRLSWPGRMIEVRTRGTGLGQLDPDRLAQVIGNLVSNALTYGTAEQPVKITSCVNDDSVELHVQNDGRPIAAELLSHIFEPMRRGEQNVKLGSRSIGLGLYIVREIATAHGGDVSVSSSEAEGTTFRVQLPRQGLGGATRQRAGTPV